ncbi:hypothetical protein BGZ96_012665 [Linnemannia gamsii]|uniref:Ricin B lectin domain-containing protein n=1 Tax=Linnemannia gamsii TaxID=64522 RepID=A0ABQ7JQ85_9FUNG|nr:hypothetical protein BGZ96_012665 [Linnemannia gamsii]
MTRLTVLFIAILVAIIQACAAFHPPEGLYQVELGQLLLTDIDGEPNEIAHLTPKDGSPAQLWRLAHEEEDRFTLRNEKSDLYLSFHGDPEPNKFLTVSRKPSSWKGSRAGDRLFIETVEKFDGERLVADISPIRIWPPRVSLAWPRKTPDQAWYFHLVDEFEQPNQYRLPYKKAGRCY